MPTKTYQTVTNAFRVEVEKGVPQQILLASWCPTADLLACVSSAGQLSLRRLSWQTVWFINPPEKTSVRFNALAWRPDGKVLAVGLSDGSIVFREVYNGDVVHTTPANSLSVSKSFQIPEIICLCWAKKESSTKGKAKPRPTYGDILTHMPTLSKIPNTDRNPGMLSARTGTGNAVLIPTVDETGDELDILIAGDSRGNFHLSVFGIFNIDIASTTWNRTAHLTNPRIVDACIQPDFSSVTIIVQTDSKKSTLSSDERTSANKQKRGERTDLVMITFDTSVLQYRANEVRKIALKSAQVHFLLQYIGDGVKAMQKEFTGIAGLTAGRMEQFRKILVANGSNTSPTLEFACLLAHGIPSPGLDQYLQRDLTEKGLSQWDKLSETGYKNIQRLVNEHVQPACERLLIFLNELNGCSKWTKQYGALGLNGKQIHSCIILIGSLVGRLEELILKIEHEAKSFKSFITWLHSALNPETVIGPIDLSSVAAFLEYSLTAEQLSPFFVSRARETVDMFIRPFEGPLSMPLSGVSISPLSDAVMLHGKHGRPPASPSTRVVKGASLRGLKIGSAGHATFNSGDGDSDKQTTFPSSCTAAHRMDHVRGRGPLESDNVQASYSIPNYPYMFVLSALATRSNLKGKHGQHALHSLPRLSEKVTDARSNRFEARTSAPRSSTAKHPKNSSTLFTPPIPSSDALSSGSCADATSLNYPSLMFHTAAILERCMNCFEASAQITAESIKKKSWIRIVEGFADAGMPRTRAVKSNIDGKTYHYAACVVQSSGSDGGDPDEEGSLYLLRSHNSTMESVSAKSSRMSNFFFTPPSGSQCQPWNGECVRVRLKPGLRIIDVCFFDDEVLTVVVGRRVGVLGKENIEDGVAGAMNYSLVTLSYVDLPYVPVRWSEEAGLTDEKDEAVQEFFLGKEGIEWSKFGHTENSKPNTQKWTEFNPNQSRDLSQFKPLQLFVNGRESRRVAGVLSEDRKKVLVFDVEGEEDDDEEIEDGDTSMEGVEI